MYKNIEKRLNTLEGRKKAVDDVEDLRGLLVALGIEDPEPYNQYMVQNTDYLICFNRGYVGNTRELVDLARKQAEKGRMHIENLAGE